MSREYLLSGRKINKSFNKPGLFRVKKNQHHVLKDVDIDIEKGKTYGLVGESGSGKSTLARVLISLLEKDGGKISYKGEELVKEKNNKDMQIVFQNPVDSLNPRMTIYEIIEDPLLIKGKFTRDERREMIEAIINDVGLSKEDLTRYPSSFSGGQAQRIAIARSIVLKPELLILDEAVSALDVSIQSQILNLLLDLQERYGLTYLFISHDLRVVRHISNRIGVMYLGRIVEEKDTDDLFKNPSHPYTQMLISSIPGSGKSVKDIGEISLGQKGEEGCPFYPRCSKKMDICKMTYPEKKEIDSGKVYCHLFG